MQNNGVYEKLNTRGKTQDDIFSKINKSVTATVVLGANSVLNPCDLLVSVDGGKTFKPAYLEEYNSQKADYALGVRVVYDGHIFRALVANPAIKTIDDDTKWEDEGVFIVNGAAMITFRRETKNVEESFKCAVAVDCEMEMAYMYSVNDACKIAGFPNILIK